MKAKPYFQNIEQEIIKHIDTAKSSIFVAVAWLTSYIIFDALLKKAKDGIDVEILLVNDDINNEKTNIRHADLENYGGWVGFVNPSFEGGRMHHKFCIIDDSVVITGSYNWSNKAKQNDENIIVATGDPELILQFKNEFTSIKDRISSKVTQREINKASTKGNLLDRLTPEQLEILAPFMAPKKKTLAEILREQGLI